MSSDHPHRLRRSVRAVIAIGTTVAVGLFGGGAASSAQPVGAARPTVTASSPSEPGVKATIVFVHGAFADAAGFGDSIAALQKRGYPVLAPANPLRGLTADTASLRAFLSTVTGDIVLVGHSYGGAVITNAATGNAQVKALVYVAAYALDEGESVDAANSLGGGTSTLLGSVEFKPIPGKEPVPPPNGDLDTYIRQDAFRAVFAADVSRREAAVMAATQRPAALTSLVEPSGVPAWKSIPSWYLVASDDKAIPPVAERAMAARAGAHTVEIKSSHAVMVSHPQAVTALVLDAARHS